MSILIVEGVTGAGKSSVLLELRQLAPWADFIPEDDTLGALMDQVRDPAWRARPRFDALERVMARLETIVANAPHANVLVERFHLTAFALFPEWPLLQPFDRRLREIGAVMALLSFPPAEADARSIGRVDRDGWDAGMTEWYGSRDAAVEAVVVSQQHRIDALQRTAIPFLHIDTRDRAWRRYAETLLAFWQGGRA